MSKATCPVEGCNSVMSEKDGRAPETRMAMHVQGSGGIHEGIDYNTALSALNAGETLTPYSDDDSSSTSANSEDSSTSHGAVDSDPVTQSGGLGIPDKEIPAGTEDLDEPECPECGGNRWFDASEQTQYEYGCPDCSDADGWVVW